MKSWMPDQHNGGDIFLTKKTRTIEVIVERGMLTGFLKCTQAAKFEIALEDAHELAQGLMQMVIEPEENK